MPSKASRNRPFAVGAALARDKGRRCVVCARHSYMGGDLCSLHRRRRWRWGHPKLSRSPILRGRTVLSAAIVPLVRQFWKSHPPPRDVIERVALVWTDGVTMPLRTSPRDPVLALRRLVLRLNDPKNRVQHIAGFKITTPRQFSKAILGSLLAVYLHIADHEREFPGDSDACAIAHVFLRHFKRTKTVTGPVRRLIAERLRRAVGLYLVLTTREFQRWRQQHEADKVSKPSPPTALLPPFALIRTNPDGSRLLVDQRGTTFTTIPPKPPASRVVPDVTDLVVALLS
jgi:hypothetical protein